MDIDISVLRLMEREKDLPFELLAKAIEEALLTAYEKTDGAVDGARVVLNRKSGHVLVLVPARFAVQVMGDASIAAIEKAGLNFADIDMLIPHQANLRIIDAAARRLDLPREKVWVNVDRYGNTSAASVPIALAEAADAGKIAEGDNVVLVAFGAGLAWAAGMVRWGTEGVTRLNGASTA